MVTYGELRYDPTFRSGAWELDAEPHVAMRLKRLFPRVLASSGRVVKVVDTPEVARDIEWALDRWPLTMTDEVAERLRAGAEQHRRTAEQVAAVLSGERLPGVWREQARAPLYEWQRINADLITANKRLLITDGLGAGKSYSGNTTFRNPDSLPGIVVVQAHLAHQWVEQLAADWPNLSTHIVRKTQPYDVDADVLVCTYSKLHGWADVLEGRVRSIVFDEAQELRTGMGTDKGRAAHRLSNAATYSVGLTGTPIYNYGGEIHNVLDIIAPTVLGSRDEFLREWCGSTYGGKPTVADPRALGAYLRDLGVMVGHNLPREDPPVRIPHVVDHDPEVYDREKGDAAELARLILSSESTNAESWKARGELDWKLRQATGLAKAPYVATFVKMLLAAGTDRVLLFGWHRAVYDVWGEALRAYNPVLYTGSESPNQKQRAKEAFLRGDSQVMILSLRSGAGIDGLQEVCHTAVFGELDWSPGVHSQCIGRLDRPGQTERVLAYFLHSEEGSDPTVLDVLGVKTAQAEPLVNPDAEVLQQQASGDVDRVRLLAEAIVSQA